MSFCWGQKHHQALFTTSCQAASQHNVQNNSCNYILGHLSHNITTQMVSLYINFITVNTMVPVKSVVMLSSGLWKLGLNITAQKFFLWLTSLGVFADAQVFRGNMLDAGWAMGKYVRCRLSTCDLQKMSHHYDSNTNNNQISKNTYCKIFFMFRRKNPNKTVFNNIMWITCRPHDYSIEPSFACNP